MPSDLLLSTAYFPPAEYFSLIKNAANVFIEQEENYTRQTYRNRCRIPAANGILTLSVPVMKGTRVKAPVKDILIDNSKRWPQVHLRAMMSAYNRSPYYQYYYESIGKIILGNHKYLLDLNDELLYACLKIIGIDKCIEHTSQYESDSGKIEDFRYSRTQKRTSGFILKPYIQVFKSNFVDDLSIIDLIFNTGPESVGWL